MKHRGFIHPEQTGADGIAAKADDALFRGSALSA